MSAEAPAEPPPFTAETAQRYNSRCVPGSPQAARWTRVATKALDSGFDRPAAIREANAAVRDQRDEPRPKS